MNAFIALVRKDLQQFLGNRKALLMSVVAPIVIAAFFGSLFGSGGSKPSAVPIAVTDLDQSPMSKAIVTALKADTALAVAELGADEALALVKTGKRRVAVVLPKGLGQQAPRAMFGGAPKPEITLHHDPSQAIALQLVRGLLTQHVMQTVSQSAFSGNSNTMADLREQALRSEQLSPQSRTDLLALFDSVGRLQAASPAASGANALSFTAPFTTRELEASARAELRYNGYAHSFAGMGVQFILMMSVDFGVALLLMRRMDLWKRLRAAPLSRATLLGSRLVSGALIALFVFTAIYAVAFVAFGVRVEGSWLGFIAVLIAFALLTTSFGLLIASLGGTPEATRGLAILATLFMVMLGGAWVPSFLFPAWLQTVSLAVPARWAVDGLDAMTWRGLPFTDALAPVGVMLAFTAAFTAIAIARFRWQE